MRDVVFLTVLSLGLSSLLACSHDDDFSNLTARQPLPQGDAEGAMDAGEDARAPGDAGAMDAAGADAAGEDAAGDREVENDTAEPEPEPDDEDAGEDCPQGRDCEGVCGGDAQEDCEGTCGGAAEEDCEGVCGGDAEEDCMGVCNGDAEEDCDGVCGGDAEEDCAGECNGTAIEDCEGTCGGDAAVDCAGVCGGDTEGDDCPCEDGEERDCLGVCGGDAQEDCSGTCNGSAVLDCNDVCNGPAKPDCLGVCEGSAQTDCNDVCEGTAVVYGGSCCAEGTADCNDDPDDGCEVLLDESTNHCGACDNACPAPGESLAVCVAGKCGTQCPPDPTCQPRATRSCDLPDGTSGRQTCGQGCTWGKCVKRLVIATPGIGLKP